MAGQQRPPPPQRIEEKWLATPCAACLLPRNSRNNSGGVRIRCISARVSVWKNSKRMLGMSLPDGMIRVALPPARRIRPLPGRILHCSLRSAGTGASPAGACRGHCAAGKRQQEKRQSPRGCREQRKTRPGEGRIRPARGRTARIMSSGSDIPSILLEFFQTLARAESAAYPRPA